MINSKDGEKALEQNLHPFLLKISAKQKKLKGISFPEKGHLPKSYRARIILNSERLNVWLLKLG